jgi:hypothetical protein
MIFSEKKILVGGAHYHAESDKTLTKSVLGNVINVPGIIGRQ